MSSGPVRKVKTVWHIFDAKHEIVGRLATDVSKLLMGKNKPTYTPHMDMGDNVIVVNAKHLRFTGKSYEKKLYRWHTGYPGGLKSMTPKFLAEVKGRPEDIIVKAVNGMLPKNKLRKRRIERLFVFKDEDHPYWEQLDKETLEAFQNRGEPSPLPQPKRKAERMAPWVLHASHSSEIEAMRAEMDAFMSKLPAIPEGLSEEELTAIAQKSAEEQSKPKPKRW